MPTAEAVGCEGGLPPPHWMMLPYDALADCAQDKALGHLADVGAWALPDDASVWRGFEVVARLLAVAAFRVPVADDRVAVRKPLNASQYCDIDVIQVHLFATCRKRVAARQTDGADG